MVTWDPQALEGSLGGGAEPLASPLSGLSVGTAAASLGDPAGCSVFLAKLLGFSQWKNREWTRQHLGYGSMTGEYLGGLIYLDTFPSNIHELLFQGLAGLITNQCFAFSCCVNCLSGGCSNFRPSSRDLWPTILFYSVLLETRTCMTRSTPPVELVLFCSLFCDPI
jgi:hypothetical protein